MTVEKINIAQKMSLFSDRWSPKLVGEVNDSAVKLVKLTGDFVWHRHDAEDELFLVIKGWLTIKLREKDIVLDPGEFVSTRQKRGSTVRHNALAV
jgi:mannose-6-phosphate isomerase-like protein (cupin superfamily)